MARKFQSPIIWAEQWNGQDGHLGVRKNNYDVVEGDICKDCTKPYREHGKYNEPNAINISVCPGDYITSKCIVRPKLYFENTFIELR